MKSLIQLNSATGFFSAKFAFSFFFFIFFSSDLSSKKIKISLSQVIQHKALDQSRNGVYDELKANGYIEGENMEWSYNNAQGSPILASQIAQKSVGQGSDVIITLGTSVTQAAVAASKGEIPVVFGSVTDLSCIGQGNAMRNVTGVTNLTPSQPQFQFFKTLVPNLQRLGVIYNPGEPNSRTLVKEMEKAAKREGIKLIFVSAFKTGDVYAATLSLKGKVDAVFVNNDNTVLAAFSSVVEAAKKISIPAFVSDIALVPQGAAGALGPDQYELGRQVGKLVIRILQGESASEIPIERAQSLKKLVNPACKR